MIRWRVVVELVLVALTVGLCWTLPLDEKKNEESITHSSAGKNVASRPAVRDRSRREGGCFVHKEEVWIVTK